VVTCGLPAGNENQRLFALPDTHSGETDNAVSTLISVLIVEMGLATGLLKEQPH
jgi:hypothetical protein